ncbi:MAG: DinB family protein [Nocardioides sp.]
MSTAPSREPDTVEPDTKDWTWVLDRPCPDCGFDSAMPERAAFGRLIRDNAAAWATALTAPAVTARPRPETWSVTEYACHVRDVHRIFLDRVALMLGEADPTFANWDQDVTAVEDRYDQQLPADVAPALASAAEAAAAAYDAVPDDAWGRRGFRSNGSEFTVDSIARYHLHDVVHHLWDVHAAVTVGAYQAAAGDYRHQTQEMPASVAAAISGFVAALAVGARVLEIGSGAGRDAAALEATGVCVRRTDVTPAFVDLMRADGVDADLLDPLTDDLGGPYDGVWASACLLHVARTDLPVVLRRLAAATRLGGVLRLSVKEGDGEAWSTHGSVLTPRLFVYWREQPLREVLAASGWVVEAVESTPGKREERWISVLARRR